MTSMSSPSLLGSSSASSGRAVSITSAFRQLQHKCRNIEIGRADAIRELDEMKRLLSENARRDSLLRSRAAAYSAETLLELRTNGSKVEGECESLKATLETLEASTLAAQNEVFDLRKRLESEEQQVGDSQQGLLQNQNRGRDYNREIEAVAERVSRLDDRQQWDRIAAAEAEARTKEAVVAAELELTRVSAEASNSKARSEAMHTYMKLLLNINKDLCDAAGARHAAETQMKKFVIIPRYSWPKGVVDTATAALTGAAAEHAMQILQRKDIKKAQKTFKDGAARVANKHGANSPMRKTTTTNTRAAAKSLSAASSSRIKRTTPAAKKRPASAPSAPTSAAATAYGMLTYSTPNHISGGISTSTTRIGASKLRKKNLNTVVHDTALKAVTSRKVGAAVRSAASMLQRR